MTNKHLVALCVFFQYLYKDSSHGLYYSHIRTLLCSFDVEEIAEKKKSHGSSNYERRFTLVPILYYWARGNSKRREGVSQIMCDTMKFDFSIYFLTLFEAHLSKK